MGNSPSELVSRSAEMSDGGLESLSKEDLKILDNPWFVLNPAEFLARSDLNYDVPGLEVPLKKDENQNLMQEESIICSLNSPQRLKEKHEDTCKALLAEILQQRGEDQAHKEGTTRLQAFVRIFEALVRTQERAVRSSKKEGQDSVQKSSFSCLSKASLVFGLNTMLNLVKCVGSLNPTIYKKLISQTSEILTNTYPCSIASHDPVYIEALGKVSNFFQSVLKGEIPNVTVENQMESISPLFGIGLSTGNLSSLLSITSEFIELRSSPQFLSTLKLLHSHLKTLQSIPSSFTYANWSKIGNNCTLSNNSTVVEHKSSSWANCFSEQEFTSGLHYFEFLAEQITTDLAIGIVDSACGSTNNELGSSNNYFFYHSNGSIKSKGSVLYTWEPFGTLDKIGIELNMNTKTLSFYKNGKIEPKPIHEGLPDSVKIVTALIENSKVSLKNFTDPPLQIAVKLYEEEKKTLENRKTLEGIDEEYMKLNPIQIAGIVIKELARINDPLLNVFRNGSRIGIPSKIGVAFHVSLDTLKLITEILEKVFKYINDKEFGICSKDELSELLASVLKLLRSHLLASLSLKTFKFSAVLQKNIMRLLEDIAQNSPNKQVYEECHEILSSCFEVFYNTPQEKLAYLTEILKQMSSGKEFDDNTKGLQRKIFAEMAYPYKLYPALIVRDDVQAGEVSNFFEFLIDQAQKDCQSILNGEDIDISIIKFLEIAQLVLFAQAASENYQGKWQEILTTFTIKYINISENLIKTVQSHMKDGKILTEYYARIEKTMLNKGLICLLNMLVLTKMSLDFLSKVLPVLGNIIASIALIPSQASKLVGGVSTVTEIYESLHNYADNLNTSQTFKIPFAKKYTLVFDPSCKTENGCDYLELWLDETKSNKVARWEGDNFPKEPFVVEAPFIVFTFHSDGSVNYWG